MRREGSGGGHGSNKRCQRHSIGKPWRKYCRNVRRRNRVRGTCSRGMGETSGAGKRGFVDSGIDMGDSQVGRLPRAEAGDYGTETGDA